MTTPNRPLAAAGVIFASMAVIALSDTFFIRVAEDAGLWQFHLVRALLALAVIALASRLSGTRMLPRRWGPVLLRGFWISASMILYFGSLAFLTVPQAAAGLFTSPLWVLVLTALVLRQRIGPRRLGAILFGFLGALFVLNPGASGLTAAHALPLAGGLLYALGAIATRTWCAGETALCLLAAFFFCMIFWGLGGIALLSALGVEAPTGAPGLMLRAWGPLTQDLALWIVALTLGAMAGLFGLTRGYQLAEASYAAAFEYSLMVFAALWAALLFGIWPTNAQIIGIAMILASGALIALSPAAQASGKLA